MSMRRPRFLLGPSNAITRPLTTVSGFSIAEVTPRRQRQAQAVPLLHHEKSAIAALTPAATTTVEMRLLLNTAGLEYGLKAIDQLWDAIGTTEQHLWIVGDDQVDFLTTSNAEVAGAAQVIEYAAPAKTWFATSDYLFVPSNGGGSGNEVVVVTAKTDGTPSFTATLAFPHASATVCYRVAICYPNAVLQ